MGRIEDKKDKGKTVIFKPEIVSQACCESECGPGASTSRTPLRMGELWVAPEGGEWMSRGGLVGG